MPYALFNIGNGSPVTLEEFITTLEDCIGIKAIKEYLPMQQGDVEKTWADISKLGFDISFSPLSNLKQGLKQFVEWYEFNQI